MLKRTCEPSDALIEKGGSFSMWAESSDPNDPCRRAEITDFYPSRDSHYFVSGFGRVGLFSVSGVLWDEHRLA